MFRLLVACSVAVMFAACGAEAPAAQPTPAPTPAAGPLQFVKPPIVLYDAEQRRMYVWARLSRPLRYNVGRSAEFADHAASLETAAGGSHDFPRMEYDPRHPTCYFEELHFQRPAPVLTDGQPLEVSLELSPAQTLTATGVVELTDQLDSHPDQELECPKAEDTRSCRRDIAGKYVTLEVAFAKRTTCGVAYEVFRRVGRWAGGGSCYRTLCVQHHRMNRGFRCDIALAGDAFWDVVCQKGRAEVRAWVAE